MQVNVSCFPASLAHALISHSCWVSESLAQRFNETTMRNFVCMASQDKRWVMPNTRIMIHHPSGAARGQAADIHTEARELLHIRDYMNAVLSNATGQPYEKVMSESWLGTEAFLHVQALQCKSPWASCDRLKCKWSPWSIYKPVQH